MSNVKVYELNYDGKASIRVQIDHDIANDELFNTINEYWVGADRNKDEENGVFNAVMKHLAQEIFQLGMNGNMGLKSIIREFEHDMEGWPRMDGSYGFKLLSVEHFCFDEDDITISEVSEGQT